MTHLLNYLNKLGGELDTGFINFTSLQYTVQLYSKGKYKTSFWNSVKRVETQLDWGNCSN